MLGQGDNVADFELPDQDGKPVRLSSLLESGPVVLYFFPRAMTPGCTAESCHFRDLAAEFAAVGAHRVGISQDSVERQAKFTGKHNFDFPLLSDESGEIAKRFGVSRPGPIFNKRATFVISQDSKILAAIQSELNMEKHADQALALLKAQAN